MASRAARFMNHIQHVRPNWSTKNVKFSEITCALSNTVYRVSHGQDKLLLRIYGSVDHGCFSREAEVQRACYMSSKGFGPKILHTFEVGRIESWLDGKAPSNKAMRGLIPSIAKKLRALHDKTGLNHNDLHHNNMFVMADGSVELLDFEYSGPLDPAYDIANHFNEWMYPYEGADPHLFQLDLYPSLAQRRDFCAHYLGDTAGKGSLVDDFLQEIESRRKESHMFWINWAEKTPNEFNRKYAQARRALLDDAPTSEPTRPTTADLEMGVRTLRRAVSITVSTLGKVQANNFLQQPLPSQHAKFLGRGVSHALAIPSHRVACDGKDEDEDRRS
eukprot:TRINITY_DN798_c0_g3_i1.p1 TRINITY_DN798_c0_g3~~TRINITY_DN798_c0_g3_i1.p1  ORF type:complete len:332 (-),score=45.06 TRINITY_DN798_c0_g3_i1:365-1360(-)